MKRNTNKARNRRKKTLARIRDLRARNHGLNKPKNSPDYEMCWFDGSEIKASDIMIEPNDKDPEYLKFEKSMKSLMEKAEKLNPSRVRACDLVK